MAHEFESGFFVKDKAWHGLGTVLENAPSIKEGLIYAGLDWNVELRDLYLENGFKVENKAVVRDTDNVVLGVVGNRYTPLQNSKAFEFFQPFLDSGLVELETAGSLKNGKRVWILAKVKGEMQIKGNDIVKKYILLANSHDGSLAISAGYTPIRVVCNNTLSMAETNKESQLLKIRHTASALITLDMVRETMNVVNQTFEATAEQYKFLASKGINKVQLEKYIKTVLKIDEKDPSTRSINQLNHVIWLWENGKGQDMPEVKHTAWTAYNAISEFLTHFASNNADNRANSLWFGTNKDKNRLALVEALKMVA